MTGRFTSQDPTGFGAGDGDLYRYVSNDPLSYTDPTGNQQVPVPPLDGKNHVTRLQAFNYNDFMAQYEASRPSGLRRTGVYLQKCNW